MLENARTLLIQAIKIQNEIITYLDRERDGESPSTVVFEKALNEAQNALEKLYEDLKSLKASKEI